MGEIYNLYEAKTHLSKLVERAASGEEIIIAKSGKPLARLTAVAETPGARKSGMWKGKAWIADDFNAPLPEDVLRGFEGDE